MGWRPEGLKSPYDSFDLREIERENTIDEVLECLKGNGTKVTLPPGYSYQSEAFRMFCENLAQKEGGRGWLIFIPDDSPSALDGYEVVSW